MENRIYRKLSVSDLELYMQTRNDFPDSICEDNVRQFLLNPMNWLFACIQDDKIIGSVRAYELNILSDKGNILYISAFGVHPQYRRQGIATELLTSIKHAGNLLGIYQIFLATEQSNTAACGLYEKLGGIFNKYFKDENDCSRLYFFNPREGCSL